MIGPVLWTIAWLAAMAAIYLVALRGVRRGHVRRRLAEEHRAAFEAITPVPDENMPWLRRWLYLAGFRRADAPYTFLTFAMVATGAGLLLALLLRGSEAMAQGIRWLEALPGGVGGLMVPILLLAPWVLFAVLAAWPWLVVRASRRRIVMEVEQDLPITLQILATLARAGLGFDASLIRVLESSDPKRVLSREFQAFRLEHLAGIGRTLAWRRFAQRLDVPAVNIFASAMVHAEQVGGGVSNVLEHQAQDVQGQRREKALIQAQSIPVKMVFPLVLCFLPAIFVWTLGPAFYQFLQVIDSVLRSGR